AELAARAARPGGGTVDASALAGRTLFTEPGTREALARLDRALLEPLRTHDGLAEALRAYLENHGQWEGTAAALGVHRHTARARVARAEDLLGVDLRSARVRAELLLALLLGDE
ncbi:helix-turn-helix domain-containing protein, partial [Tsukamurella tyrosinosolvens]